VHQVVFNVMQANGRAHTFFDQLFPRYTEIAERFRMALAATGEARPMAFLVDIPLCTTEGVPDFNRGYVEKHRHYDLESEVAMPLADLEARRGQGKGKGLLAVTRADLDQARRTKRDECLRCRYHGVCEGVWTNYLARYGWDEMVPVPPAAAAE
jgi:cyclic pyranopterin phosphate synthase